MLYINNLFFIIKNNIFNDYGDDDDLFKLLIFVFNNIGLGKKHFPFCVDVDVAQYNNNKTFEIVLLRVSVCI